MGAEGGGVEPGLGAARLDDQIDRLRGQSLVLQRSPTVDRAKNCPLRNPGFGDPRLKRQNRRPDQQHAGVLVGRAGFGSPEHDGQAGQGFRLRIGYISVVGRDGTQGGI
jgi:hypothetical protein